MSEATAPLRIMLLGGFASSVDGVIVVSPWRLRKAKTLVKLLALRADHRVHRDVLVDQLWPDADATVAANNLHQTLHAARRTVGAEHLVLSDDVVVLGADSGVSVDVAGFARCSGRGARSVGMPPACCIRGRRAALRSRGCDQ